MAKPRKMTGSQYSEAIAALGLNQVTAAHLLQITVRTSHTYANGGRIPRAVQLLLEIMMSITSSRMPARDDDQTRRAPNSLKQTQQLRPTIWSQRAGNTRQSACASLFDDKLPI
jgi:hypothetical protein